MRSIETSAKTRQEAIQKALDELGVELADVEIEILNEGSRGIFGIGARDVKVRVSTEVPDERPQKRERPRREREREGEREKDRSERPSEKDRRPQPAPQARPPREPRPPRPARPQPSEPKTGRQQASEPRPGRQQAAASSPKPASKPAPAKKPERPPAPPLEPLTEAHRDKAAELLRELLAKMGLESTVTGSLETDGGVRLAVESPDSAILIGHKGRNLQSLQYLINRMVRGDAEATERIVVDIERYQERREESLREMARQFAQRAKDSRREVRCKPLSPQERRIIHLTLQDDPDVRTFSIGNGSVRTVIIAPKAPVKRSPQGARRQGQGSSDRKRFRGRRNRPQGQGPRTDKADTDAPAPESDLPGTE